MRNEDPRKLLFVIHHLSPSGGAEIQMAHLARGLTALGDKVTIACLKGATADTGALEALGIEVVKLGAESIAERARALPRLYRLARDADVVMCAMWDASFWGRVAAIAARRPVIIAEHSTNRSLQRAFSGAPRARWIALHNRLLDPFTYATVSCATTQREMLLREGVGARKIVYIPNGIPLHDPRAAGKLPTRAEIGVPEDAPMALQVGVFRKEKNQTGGLEAFAAARRSSGVDAHLVFVGEGPLRSQVEDRAGGLDAAGWVHFLGHRDDVPGLLAIADLMILPSISDAMPMTVLEAMAAGVPVLATDVGDVRQTLAGAGVTVPAGDFDAFQRELTRLLTEPDARAALGAEGRRRGNEFDAETMNRRYAALFEAACVREPPAEALAADHAGTFR